MKNYLALSVLTAFAVTSAWASTGRVAMAADAMTSMDCTQAESLLDSAVSSKASTIMTGNVDSDFATLMMLHEKVGKRIDEIEAKCGKNAKMQAMAAKGSDDAQERMNRFRNLGTSQ